MKFGRNKPCPCGRIAKYKKCCYPNIDWDKVVDGEPQRIPSLLTIRGKNIGFVNAVADALQLDHVAPTSWSELKRAVTPTAVRKIHSALQYYWPNQADLSRVLAQDQHQERALYVGSYEPASVLQGLTRHILYSDKILLFDPFVYPGFLKPEFDPIENPQKHIVNTLKWVGFWLKLAPWIDAGLVEIVRNPDDYDPALLKESAEWQIAFHGQHRAEIETATQSTIKDDWSGPAGDEFRLFNVLIQSDDALVQDYLAQNPEASPLDIDRLLAYIRQQRADHAYYSEGVVEGRLPQFVTMTTGANYYTSKAVAAVAGAHLITDMRVRWKEIELDRSANGAELGAWTPFAKAFQGLTFSFLDQVPLDAALNLRREERLDGMRSFLRSVWRTTKEDNELADHNIVALADELGHRIAEADEEWKKIDRELLKWLSLESGTALAATATVGAGAGVWLAGGWAVAGLGQLASAWMQRSGFRRRYPASFFLELRRGGGR